MSDDESEDEDGGVKFATTVAPEDDVDNVGFTENEVESDEGVIVDLLEEAPAVLALCSRLSTSSSVKVPIVGTATAGELGSFALTGGEGTMITCDPFSSSSSFSSPTSSNRTPPFMPTGVIPPNLVPTSPAAIPLRR
jgi:hypothetical protein